jgi:hypothetical protein
VEKLSHYILLCALLSGCAHLVNLEKKKNATEQEGKKRVKAPAKSDIMGGSPGNDGKWRVSG